MAIITCRELGRMGRFANQLFQYGTLATIARELDCEFQCPQWVGEWIFGIPNHPITHDNLPRHMEQYDAGENPLTPPIEEFVNKDGYGYFQYHCSFWTPERQKMWTETFQPTEEWRQRMEPALLTLKSRGQKRIGIHIRRGDYGTPNSVYAAITPVSWYLRWLEEHWDDYHNPVLFIASEDMALVDEFRKYEPETVTSLGIKLKPVPYKHYPYLREDLRSQQPHLLDFAPDWLTLCACDVLVAANSTFSFTAALCGKAQLWRPGIAEGRFVEENKLDCYPLRKDCPKQK